MIARAICCLVILVSSTSSTFAGDSGDYQSLGSVDGVEFYVNFKTKCAYGGIKNRTTNKLEIWWTYVATWKDGHTETQQQHDFLDPGESKAGWGYYLLCADDHGPISRVRVDNVRVKDLTLEEKKKEEAAIAKKLEDDRKKEEERLAREREEAVKEKERLDRLKKEQEDRENKERLDRIKKEQEERDRIAKKEKEERDRKTKKEQATASSTKKSKQSSGAGSGGGGGCDAGCQRQQQLTRELERQRQTNEANIQMGNAMGNAASHVFLAKGGNEAQSGSTRLFALTFGFGMRLAPVMTDTAGAQINSFSSQDSGGGLSLALGFEYWPLYRRWFGLGFVGGAAAGGLAMPGGGLYQLYLEGGARAYLGNRAGWSIAGELGLLRTSLGYSSNLLGAITEGSGSSVATRVGAGPSWCAIENEAARGQCTLSITGKLLFDVSDLADTARVYQFTLDWHSGFLGRLGLYFELGRGYPAPGSTMHPLDAEDQDRAGTRIAVMLTKGFTWFGSGGGSTGARSASRYDSSDEEEEPTGGSVSNEELADIVWASRVLDVSSEYGVSGYSAKEALGPPNVYPLSGDLVGSWASRTADSSPEHIEVAIPARRAKAIVVVETYNPGAIARIVARTSSDVRLELSRRSTKKSSQGGALTTFEFDGGCTDEPIATALVELDSPSVSGWNEIDAIGLVPCDE